MNASRAFTLRYGALLSVGRVQTPTLAMLVKMSEYFNVSIDYLITGKDFQKK